MTLFDHVVGILSTSACLWLLFNIYLIIRIERFIVKRYEQETDLSDTVYFREHATFTRIIPKLFSSALYTAHLLTFIWCWNFFKNRKPYRDVTSASEVTRYFSNREIKSAKWYAISCIIVAIHGIAYCIFRSIWPEVFD
jgi:hypothetical protein